MENREVGFVVNDEYKAWIEDLKNRIKQSQIKAAVKVNYELLDLYWGIGRDIVAKQKHAKWGDAFLATMSKDLQRAFLGGIISGLCINVAAFRRHCFMYRRQWIMAGAGMYWNTK